MKLTVLFVLAALQLVSARPGPQFRKSLSFGPTLGHARFEQVVASSGYAPSDKDRHPHRVARDFMADHHPRTDGNGWVIRTDSYTDKRTGVSHVYLVQHIHDVPVADGVIHLNIKDGRVISYGDSFFKGTVPDHVSATFSRNALANSQRAYCANLEDHVTQPVIFDQQQGAQVPLNSEHGDGGLHPSIADVHKHNCAQSDLAFNSLSGDQLASPAAAVLSFMIQATPDAGLAEDISANMASHMNKIVPTVTHHVNGQTFMSLANVPGAVKPVKAHHAYVQTPSSDGKSSELNLVWKLEVEMQDNWYDAAVSVADPSVILSVVDWVSDSPYYPQPDAAELPSGTALPTSRLGRPQPPRAGRVKIATDHKLSEGGPHKYNVFPWGINDPTDGKRELLSPQPDALASPHGWHSIAAANDPAVTSRRAPTPGRQTLVNYTSTFGNNVFTQENWEGRGGWLDNYRPVSSTKWPNLTFDYKYDPKAEDDGLAEAQQWINNTITQLFYTVNQVHDLYYRYGFDEVSGNFQQSNWGRGGAENDGIIANAQDGSGYNNANFATPPDGQNGRCRMYLWNTATPYRDGDLEAGIVIHEVSHGLSTRLTGGPADSSCLAWGESGGMGEGWGDFIATMIRANEKYQDFPMGAWAANQKGGIRNYPYSLEFTVNPSTYATLDKYWGVHAIGEVWAEILWTVAQKFIKKHGFSSTLFPPQVDESGEVPESNDFYRPRPRNSVGEFVGPYVPKHGNTLILQLVFDGMKIQPCRPGFFEARDAIIQADEILTGGENLCELWEGFSERGLGPAATVIGKTPWGGGVRKDDFAVPSACRKEPKEPKKSSWF